MPTTGSDVVVVWGGAAGPVMAGRAEREPGEVGLLLEPSRVFLPRGKTLGSAAVNAAIATRPRDEDIREWQTCIDASAAPRFPYMHSFNGQGSGAVGRAAPGVVGRPDRRDQADHNKERDIDANDRGGRAFRHSRTR